MTSNTLRGGKNQYSSAVRCGNWFEQKLEPRVIEDFVSYQDIKPEVRFSSSYGTAFVACSEQIPPFKGPEQDPKMVTEYRKTWTNGEPWQFERTIVGPPTDGGL